MGSYLETDEQIDVLVSVEELDRQLDRARFDPMAWKWVIVTLASALNGALTCHLSGTMQVGALDKKVAEKTIAALQHDSNSKMPDARLAPPKELLKRSISTVRIETGGKPIRVSERQRQSFNLMFEFRNQFLHFSPSGWGIEVSGLPLLALDCIEILSETAGDGWSFRHLSEVDGMKLRNLIDCIKQKLAQF